MSHKEWNKFKIGTPSIDRRSFNKDCMPFDFVNHVSHVESSKEILKRQSLVAGLVFDESKLNSERILVNWLSPNHWYNGFRYGNICFKIPFNKSVLDYNFYWVESIAYGVEACRILITKNDYDFLEKYDPNIPNGPWWYDKEKDKHYYNSNFCL